MWLRPQKPIELLAERLANYQVFGIGASRFERLAGGQSFRMFFAMHALEEL
jgi:hypothetical protein